MTRDVTHRAARIRARTGLRLPDAAQAAITIKTASLGSVTYDRDFSALDRSPEQIAVFS